MKTSSSKRNRSGLLFGVLSALVMIASACGVTRDSAVVPAATIEFADGTPAEVTSDDLNEVMDAVRGSERFTEAAFGGEIPDNFEAQILSSMIVEQAIDHLLAEEGLTVSQSDIDEELEGLLGDVQNLMKDEIVAGEVFEELVPYLNSLANLNAQQQMLATAVDLPQLPCASHILVEELAEAEDLLEQLADGADFAALATEFSLDPGSGAQGGSLGCADPANYVETFRTAIEGGEEGELMGPVESEFGFHIIVIDGYEDDESQSLSLVSEMIGKALGTSAMTIDPQIGTWNASTNSVVAAIVQDTDSDSAE